MGDAVAACIYIAFYTQKQNACRWLGILFRRFAALRKHAIL